MRLVQWLLLSIAGAVIGLLAVTGLALTLARETPWMLGGLAGAALLFGAIGALSLYVLDRRLADQHQATLDQIEHSRRMLAESQRIARVGSWRLQLADMSLEWSDESYRIVGIDPTGFTPTPEAYLARVHPEDEGRLRAARERVFAGSRAHDLEFRLLRDGEVRHVHERAEIERDPSGVARYLTGTIQDVTERRQLLDWLYQYRRLIEASSDHFAIIDADFRYILCNAGYAGLLQLERSAVEGRYVAHVLDEKFFEEQVRPPVERCLAGVPQAFEAERYYPHLGKRQVLVRYYPIASPDGQVQQVGMVMTDVTDLKQAEAEVREQRHLISMAGRLARLGGWSVDLRSGRILCSDVAAEIHGMRPGYAPGLQEAMDYYVPQHRERIEQLFSTCAEQGIPFDAELRIVDARGRRRWVRATGEPVRNEQGEIDRVEGAFQDISAAKGAEEEITRIGELLQTTVESITDAFFTLDADWCFTYVNAEATRILRASKEVLLSRNLWEMFPGLIGTYIERDYRRAMAEGTPTALEDYYYPRLERWFDIRAYPSDEGLAIFFRDVSERRRFLMQIEARERDLRQSRDELAHSLETRQTLINALPAHIALLDASGQILDVNDQWRRFGRENGNTDRGSAVGTDYLTACESTIGATADDAAKACSGLRAVLSGEREQFTLEYPCHTPGHARWFRMMANRLGGAGQSADHGGAVVMHIDVTERKLAEQELDRLAYEDTLTALPSRNGFIRGLAQRIAASGWQAHALVIAIDVHHLRDINDAHGYAAGDQFLQQIARRLETGAGDGTVIGRIGGDEFAVYLPERSDAHSADRRAAIAGALATPFELEQLTVEASATYGYTRLGVQRREIEDLLREAELALFQSRRGNDARSWTAYTSGLHDETRRRTRITRKLRRALEADELELYFQPKVDLRDGSLVGSEALIRWRHPEHGLLLPGTFIPTAERSQLIGPIGAWVVNEACRRLSEWQRDGLDIVRTAVNVSLMQFMVGDLTEIVRQALATWGVEPGALTLEITESVFERESEALLGQLRALHDMGVRLSLDDFGTGYSSLLYLQKYPFDEIKIDRGFVHRMLDDEYSGKIVATVLAIAAGLGAETAAEGVETAAVRDALLVMGCYFGQGFYYSMPLAAEGFRSLLETHTRLPLPAQP